MVWSILFYLMPEINIVIPCYNEAARLQSERFCVFLHEHAEVALLFVNDGSIDSTQQVLEEMQQRIPEQIDILHLPVNSGKAEAVRRGLSLLDSNNPGTWYGYWDADLSTPLEEIFYLLSSVKESTRMILGSRVKRLGSAIQRKVWRHISGRIMATLISWTLNLAVYDTQCGAKLIHREMLGVIIDKPFLSKWLFDVEIISRLRIAYHDRPVNSVFFEVPLRQWIDVDDSKLKLHHIPKALLDLVKIRKAYSKHTKKFKRKTRP